MSIMSYWVALMLNSCPRVTELELEYNYKCFKKNQIRCKEGFVLNVYESDDTKGVFYFHKWV